MKTIDTSCCFIGHRAEKLSCPLDELARQLSIAIDDAVRQGHRTFYHGGCIGADLIAAEQVLLYRKDVTPDLRKNLRLIGVLPYEEQANRWNEHWRYRYFTVLEQCDEVITLHARYVRGCYHERNR